ncbi:MAG: PqqD family protein, partial [Clostridia bacterium]|nr:PqqD family protein [Clostridia bacterium]
MKIKEGFITKKVAGDVIVIPAEQALVDFKAIITLNETGAYLWELLKEDISKEKLLENMLKEYDADEKILSADIDEFLSVLEEKGLL